MLTEQLSWSAEAGWRSIAGVRGDAQLVLYFGANEALEGDIWLAALRDRYPHAHLVGCSTGGQIQQSDIREVGIEAVAIRFEATSLRLARVCAQGPAESRAYGVSLGEQLLDAGLSGVFVLSDGLNVNGSELVRGLQSALGSAVCVSGGMAGDGARFFQTRVGVDEAPRPLTLVAIGFYGNAVRFTCGSGGGWDPFGIPRRVTRSAGNELFELDGKPALDLYERYLGEEAAGLPGTALLYPLKIWGPDCDSNDVVRGVLSVNRDLRSMIFAGDVPQGCKAQLMRGEFTRLAEGATDAARQALVGHSTPGTHGCLALLVSCIGRRLLMGQRIEDEIHAVRGLLSADVPQIGFYSYGEIAPHCVSHTCELHNQTMTVTLLSEIGT